MISETTIRLSYRVGPYVVDGHMEEVRKGQTRVPLTSTAFGVFYQLVEQRGRVVLRGEFEPWCKEYHADRNPVDGYIAKIRKELGKSIVKTVRGKGYRLSPEIDVERIPNPSLSKLERLLVIVLDQIKIHTSSSFAGTIKNCEELLSEGHIAEAYARMALAYLNLGHVAFCRQPRSTTILRARKIIDEALKWFPSMGSALAIRGLIFLINDLDWARAEADFVEALRLNPDNSLAHLFLAHLKIGQGEIEEALNHAHVAGELDYDRPIAVVTEPWFMLFAGHVDEAVSMAKNVADRFAQFSAGHVILGHALYAFGAPSRAIAQYNIALEIEFRPDVIASLGYVHAREGNRAEALKSLDILKQAIDVGKIAYVSSYLKALVFAGLGDKNRCLNALQKAFDERCDWLIHMAVEPRWRELQGEERFRTLLRHIGVSEPRIACGELDGIVGRSRDF